jgi:acyl carrier protein
LAAGISEAEIYSELTDLFQELFGDDDIVVGPETTAQDIDGWDSFNHLNVIAGVEQRFGIKMQTKEIEGLTNVGDIAKLVIAKRGSR